MGKIYRNGKTITPTVKFSDDKDMLQQRVDEINSASYLFYNYTGQNVDYISRLDTSNVTSMEKMFSNAGYLTTIPTLNTEKVTNMSQMFYSCGNIAGRLSIPMLNTGNVTNMSQMFRDCQHLLEVPLLNTSNVTDMSSMFNGCWKISTIPLFNTSKVTDMGGMFRQCKELTTIPLFDTSKVKSMYVMFGESGIISVPPLDTSNVTTMYNMFQNCSSLTTISSLDLVKVTSSTNLFANCSALENLTIKNIKVTLQIGSGTTWGHLLTKESLLNTVKELWDMSSTSSKTLTVSTTSKTTLDGIYVKLIAITDEMRAEDPYIDNKKPFEECESTDAGAMLITDYATTQKNWTITA